MSQDYEISEILSKLSTLSLLFVTECDNVSISSIEEDKIENILKEFKEEQKKEVSTYMEKLKDMTEKKFQLEPGSRSWWVKYAVFNIAHAIFKDFSKNKEKFGVLQDLLYDKIEKNAQRGHDFLDYKKYLEPNNLYLQNVDAIQYLYYWSFHANVAYENEQSYKYLTILTKNEKEYFAYGNAVNLEFLDYAHIYKPPYYMYIDDITKTIVIGIRGTASVSDIIADISGDMVQFGEKPDELIHEGFYLAAKVVVKDLENLLEDWANEFPNLEVVVTGHSYGAGISSVVTLLLNQMKNSGRFKNIKSIRGTLFACPPVFSTAAASNTCHLMTSIIFGWDTVPTLSANNVFKLTCHDKEGCIIDKSKRTIHCPAYVPGTIYWMTYDVMTYKAVKLYLISPDHPRLTNVIIQRSMGHDHSMMNYQYYLLSILQDNYSRIKKEEKGRKIKESIKNWREQKIKVEEEKKRRVDLERYRKEEEKRQDKMEIRYLKEKKIKLELIEKIRLFSSEIAAELEYRIILGIEELKKIFIEQKKIRNELFSSMEQNLKNRILYIESKKGTLQTNFIRKNVNERNEVLSNMNLTLRENILKDEKSKKMAFLYSELLNKEREMEENEIQQILESMYIGLREEVTKQLNGGEIPRKSSELVRIKNEYNGEFILKDIKENKLPNLSKVLESMNFSLKEEVLKGIGNGSIEANVEELTRIKNTHNEKYKENEILESMHRSLKSDILNRVKDGRFYSLEELKRLKVIYNDLYDDKKLPYFYWGKYDDGDEEKREKMNLLLNIRLIHLKSGQDVEKQMKNGKNYTVDELIGLRDFYKDKYGGIPKR
jgi:hypothetical protein